MNYSVAQASRIGGRKINQDRAAWLATDAALLMVVADGMGGHLQGEVAAQIAIDTLLESFRREAQTRLADPARFLADSLRLAHRTIVRYSADCRIPLHAAPRTTCIACVVQDARASWAHAGDSRLYLIHGQATGAARVTRTRDHSLVQRLIDAGRLSHAEASSHPSRHRVFSCLGGDEPPQIEVSPPVALQDGDLIALCTDGAWAPLGDTLATELGRSPLTNSVPHLLEAAEQAAGPDGDNLTLLVMRWEGSEPEASSRAGTPTSAPRAGLSDEDIGHAVAKLRQRLPHSSNGAS